MHRYVFTDYIDEAMKRAVYEKLEDGTYSGEIPECTGVLSFAETQSECQEELQSVLEDWILLGIKLGHPLPVIAGIDLNKAPEHEPLEVSRGSDMNVE